MKQNLKTFFNKQLNEFFPGISKKFTYKR